MQAYISKCKIISKTFYRVTLFVSAVFAVARCLSMTIRRCEKSYYDDYCY